MRVFRDEVICEVRRHVAIHVAITLAGKWPKC